LRIYNEDTATEVANDIVAGTTYVLAYSEGDPYSTGDVVTCYLTYASAATARIPYKFTAVVASTGWSAVVSQEEDEIYVANAIDGSSVTEFSTDFVNLEMDIADGDGQTTVQRIWAFYVYTLFSEDGIREWFDGMTAIDDVNYLVDTDIIDMHLDNVSASPVRVIGGRIYRSDGTTMISGTSYSIHIDPNRVYSVQTGISGLTTEESESLVAISANVLSVKRFLPALL
jgi:hypothetical protein